MNEPQAVRVVETTENAGGAAVSASVKDWPKNFTVPAMSVSYCKMFQRVKIVFQS